MAIEPEQVSPEKELVLKIWKIINFPGYQQGTNKDRGENLKGPYAGGDIAVYKITSESKQKARKSMKEGTLAPACLPQRGYEGERGIFAGWLDQEPFYRLSTTNIKTYEREYLTIKTVEVLCFYASFTIQILISQSTSAYKLKLINENDQIIFFIRSRRLSAKTQIG
mgnify:CR=1 FL=1